MHEFLTNLTIVSYKVWQVRPTSETQQQLLLQQWQPNDDVDFWDSLNAVGDTVRIMVAPLAQPSFLQFLRQHSIEHELIIRNVEQSVQLERHVDQTYRQQDQQADDSASRIVSDFNHFWQLDEIDQYISALERLHPDIVSTEIFGYSTEGRPLRVVNVSLRGRGIVNGSLPIVFIDAGIHAREWVSHHAALYILKQLVENNGQNLHILEKIDLVVFPIVNPDGYAYTRDHVSSIGL